MRIYLAALTPLLPAWLALGAHQEAKPGLRLRSNHRDPAALKLADIKSVDGLIDAGAPSGIDYALSSTKTAPGNGHRKLTEGMFTPLSCNTALTVADCEGESAVPFSEIVGAVEGGTGEAHVPCGICAKVDYADGDFLDIPSGVNVEGMLYFPPSANVEIYTPHVFVQGILKIDAPADGNRVKVLLHDNFDSDQIMIPHADNAAVCDMTDMCNMGRKVIAVAGGKLDIQALPDPTCPTWMFLEAVLDEATGNNQVLKVGSAAAECWGRRLGDELLITDTVHMGVPYASLVGVISEVNIEAGTITLEEPPKKKDGTTSAGPISTLENDPDFPAEVAWLSRSVVFDAETKGIQAGHTYWWCSDAKIEGGHMIIAHTSGVAQIIEGVQFKNFGQGGKLGRYPIHFHMSSDVDGSIVKKNVIHSSNQRCVVIHQSNNINVEENVAFGHKGHCFMLEDSVETGNVFRANLGVDGWLLHCLEDVLLHKGDDRASTFWISNPHNQYIDNVAAGSINGFWLDMSNSEALEVFSGNRAHSNLVEGIKLYRGGYSPDSLTLLENTKSFRNFQQGIRLHVNKNIKFKGLLLADNGQGVSSFDNGGQIELEDAHIIGLTKKARDLFIADPNDSSQALVDPYPELSAGVAKLVELQPPDYRISGVKFAYDPDFTQLVLRNTTFSGFGAHSAVTEYDIIALRLWEAFPGFHNAEGSILTGGDRRYHDMPILESVVFDSPENSFDVQQSFKDEQGIDEQGIDNSKNLYLQDISGSMSDHGPGVFIMDELSSQQKYLVEHNSLCSPAAPDKPGSIALFCPGACIRKVIATTGCEHNLVITSSTSGDHSLFSSETPTFGSTYQHEFFVPNENFSITCQDANGLTVNPIYISLHFDGRSHHFWSNFGFKGDYAKPEPTCAPYVTEDSFQLPDPLLHQQYQAEGLVINGGITYGNKVLEGSTVSFVNYSPGDYVTYGPINFGSPGESPVLRIRYAAGDTGGILKVRLGGPDLDGELFCTIQCLYTGWDDYIERDIPINVSGSHQVTFQLERFAGTHGIVDVDWFEILPTQEIPLHVRQEAELPLSWVGASFHDNDIKMAPGESVTYGPINFGSPGESGVLRIRYNTGESAVSIQARLGGSDGYVFATIQLINKGWGNYLERDIPINVEGVHEVTLTCHRSTGTHDSVGIDWFEILPTQEIPLHVRHEAELPLYWSGIDFNSKVIDGSTINYSNNWQPNNHATFGPINFGGFGESAAMLIRYAKGNADGQLKVTLGGQYGEEIAVFWLEDTGEWDLFIEQVVPINVQGVHEVTFTAHRGYGTHGMVNLDWIEILASAPTMQPTITGFSGGKAKLDQWYWVDGTNIDALRNDERFPDQPDVITTVEDLLEAPTNIADNYASRLSAYINPPTTGSYTFWIASDDGGELYLSADTEEGNKVLIANVPGWTHSRQYDKYSEQNSGPIELIAGEIYYIEALHKEGGGGDNLSIAWALPGYSTPSVIEGQYFQKDHE